MWRCVKKTNERAEEVALRLRALDALLGNLSSIPNYRMAARSPL